MENKIRINAIAFMEGGSWIVQGLEKDIVTRAASAGDVPRAFVRALAEHIYIAKHLGIDPFDSVDPAPERFHEMFREAESEVILRPDLAGIISTPAVTTLRLAA